LYDETAVLQSPRCDQFVILISRHDHMPLTSGFAGGQIMENWGVRGWMGYMPGLGFLMRNLPKVAVTA